MFRAVAITLILIPFFVIACSDKGENNQKINESYGCSDNLYWPFMIVMTEVEQNSETIESYLIKDTYLSEYEQTVLTNYFKDKGYVEGMHYVAANDGRFMISRCLIANWVSMGQLNNELFKLLIYNVNRWHYTTEPRVETWDELKKRNGL